MTTGSSSYGASQSVNATVCMHGTVLLMGTPDRCDKCDDERWTDWFSRFIDRWEAKHGSRFPVHGYDWPDLREAFLHLES